LVFSSRGLGYVISAVISGKVEGKFNLHTYLALSGFIFGIFSVITALTSSFLMICLAFFFMGLAYGI